MDGLADWIVSDDIEDEVCCAVVDELMRLARFEDKRVPGLYGLCAIRVPHFAGAGLVRRRRAPGIRLSLLLLQGKDLLRCGSAIRVMLMDGVLEFLVIFLHMIFVLLLVQLVLVFR